MTYRTYFKSEVSMKTSLTFALVMSCVIANTSIAQKKTSMNAKPKVVSTPKKLDRQPLF